MAAIGIGLLWSAYTLGFYGYCLFRGYDVSPKELLSPNWPPGEKQADGGGAARDLLPPNGGKAPNATMPPPGTPPGTPPYAWRTQ